MQKKRLHEHLRYDILTGIFYSRKTDQVVGKLSDDEYMEIWIDGIKYKACDLAWFYMYGDMPKRPIIHRDSINSNDWIDNLKMSPNVEKLMSNTSGVPGVSWDKRDRRWRAQIFNKTKQKNLGNYKNFDLAVLARFKAEEPNSNSPAAQYINKMFL